MRYHYTAPPPLSPLEHRILLITICQWVLLSKNWGLKVTGENPKNNNLIFWEDRGDNFEDNIRLVTRWRETRNFQYERVMH